MLSTPKNTLNPLGTFQRLSLLARHNTDNAPGAVAGEEEVPGEEGEEGEVRLELLELLLQLAASKVRREVACTQSAVEH